MTTNTAIGASNLLKLIEQLPRYSYGYKSDEWGMGSHLTSFIKDTGQFLKRDEVLAALSSAAQPPAPREPLTDKQIDDLVATASITERNLFRRFARAIEAAHGITTN